MTRTELKLVDYRTVDEALTDLCSGLCPSDVACHFCEPIPAKQIPDPFANLLVHRDHMTARLREHHGQPIALRVLDEVHEDPLYRRKIVLTLGGTPRVVEFGVVRIDFRFAPPDARKAILEQRVPLGDVLMRCTALRQIQPRWYVKLSARCPIFAEFCDDGLDQVYGRIGTIYCDGEPAVEVLEVVTTARTDAPDNPNNLGIA
ncbi:MAG: hypothetical protein PVI86_18970 [Phycisphaerae bacterium]|jgi:hypothetical protein